MTHPSFGVQNRYQGVDSARRNPVTEPGGDAGGAAPGDVPAEGGEGEGGLAPTRPFGPRPPRLAGAASPAPRRGARRRRFLVAGIVTAGVLAVAVGAGLGRPARPSMAGTPAPDAGRVVASQPVVEHAGHRYGLGRPGDVALVGDWDCDGKPTPALYRPSTGEAFVFDTWATAARPSRAVSAGRHRQGGVASVSKGSDGCDQLSVVPHENA